MILPTRFFEKGNKYDVNITAEALMAYYGATSRGELADHFKPYYDPTNNEVRVDHPRKEADKKPAIRFSEGEAKVLHPAYIAWADSEPGTWTERFDPVSNTVRPTEETPGVPDEEDGWEIEDEATVEKTAAFEREVWSEMEANASIRIDDKMSRMAQEYERVNGKSIPQTMGGKQEGVREQIPGTTMIQRIDKQEKFVDIAK